jgi:hypothetical protein
MPNSLFYVNPPPKLPLAMISWMQNPPIQPYFLTTITTNAQVNFGMGFMELVAPSASSDEEALAYFEPLSMYYELTYDKQRELKIDLDLEMQHPELCQFEIGWYNRTGTNAAYLQLDGGDLYFITTNTSGQESTYIKSYTPGENVYEPLKLHFKHYPGARTELWINDAEAYNNNQNVPAGLAIGTPEAYFRASSTYQDTDNGYIRLLIKYIELYQQRT